MSEIKRRDFLKVLGLTGAGTSLVGCAQEPAQRLIPYLVQPEEIIPGVPNWYASVCRECPAGCGVHVKVIEGRPIKVEGNPDHPVNAGRLCARGQASLQGLYNPDRITSPLLRVEGSDGFEPIAWDDAEAMLADRIRSLRAAGQADRLHLMRDGTLGSFQRLTDDWMAAIGSPNLTIHESFDAEPTRAANRLTFGLDVIPKYDIASADLILSFGAGFLETWISPVQYARGFAAAHSFHDGRMARFVHVGPRLSLTGSNADEWVSCSPTAAMQIALAMTRTLIDDGGAGARGEAIRPLVEGFTPDSVAEAAGVEAERIARLAREFANSPSSLALPPGTEGTHRNATGTNVAVNLLNYVAGNVGRTVRFGPNVLRQRPAGVRALTALIEAMRGGEIDVLMIHGTDPVHTLPDGMMFEESLSSVGLVVSFASFMDETAARADLILPNHTPLESWDDHAPEVGVYGLMQPTINPLFDTKSTGDVLLSLAARLGDDVGARFTAADFQSYVQNVWRESIYPQFAPSESFDDFWHAAVSRGGVWRDVGTTPVTLDRAVSTVSFDEPSIDGDASSTLTLIAYPSPTLYDGRGANRSWLQELPDPVTKVVWNSWVEIHPETAANLGVETGDAVTIVSPHGSLEAPVYIYRGIERGTVAIPIGQGHTQLGRYAQGRGVNPLDLLDAAVDESSGSMAWLSTRVQVQPTGRRARLVVTQGSDTDHDREIAEVISLALAAEEEEHGAAEIERDPNALIEFADDADPKSPYRWGMAIDLSSCIGCSACVTACYAENNVPIVGEERCAEGREMSWIRIDRYYEHVLEGDGHGTAAHEERDDSESDDFHVVHLPMLCQHCGNAPCEPVCPVYATYHNPEGLNVQVYNRCVGTRYCSNNCPYKVRRFEYFTYDFPYPLNLQLNPDVTVREKGVMEKCTFCVQRISAAKHAAVAEGRELADGEITPACAQTCPADAIIFGNLRDPNSRVSRAARDGRGYHVLDELYTRPAITYLREVSRGAEEA